MSCIFNPAKWHLSGLNRWLNSFFYGKMHENQLPADLVHFICTHFSLYSVNAWIKNVQLFSQVSLDLTVIFLRPCAKGQGTWLAHLPLNSPVQWTTQVKKFSTFMDKTPLILLQPEDGGSEDVKTTKTISMLHNVVQWVLFLNSWNLELLLSDKRNCFIIVKITLRMRF